MVLSEYAIVMNGKRVDDVDRYCRCEGIDRQYLAACLSDGHKKEDSPAGREMRLFRGLAGLNLLNRMKSRA